MDAEESFILDVTPTDGTFDSDFLERLGHPVLVCHGPDWGSACPILKGSCAKVDQVHGVVFQLDLERPQHRSILQRYQEVLPEDVPVRAVVSQEQADTYADLLRGVQTWLDEPTAGDLDGFAAEVEAADDSR
jgi:hypothetical protein